MESFLLTASLYFLIPVMIIAPVDGIYLHLVKYKLQENPESRKEHLVHTLRSFLFFPISLLLFVWNVSGPLLYLLMGVLVFDFILEIADLIEERRSRDKLGGIPHLEYMLHMIVTATRTTATTLALSSKPFGAWFQSIQLPENPEMMRFMGEQFMYGSIVMTLVHVILIFKPRLVSQIGERLR